MKTDGTLTSEILDYPAAIYLLKFNNRNAKTRC